jgi:hypothetical protein
MYLRVEVKKPLYDAVWRKSKKTGVSVSFIMRKALMEWVGMKEEWAEEPDDQTELVPENG